jgi:hypothetical protein
LSLLNDWKGIPMNIDDNSHVDVSDPDAEEAAEKSTIRILLSYWWVGLLVIGLSLTAVSKMALRTIEQKKALFPGMSSAEISMYEEITGQHIDPPDLPPKEIQSRVRQNMIQNRVNRNRINNVIQELQGAVITPDMVRSAQLLLSDSIAVSRMDLETRTICEIIAIYDIDSLGDGK